MGLFSKKRREPRVHPTAERTIAVSAPLAAVITQVQSYGALHSLKHATSHDLVVRHHGGWTTIQLPPQIHPWTFHNLGFWMLDTAGGGERIVLHASATADHPAYTLVPDPEIGDCLCGVDGNGEGWTVSVPTNEIVRPTDAPASSAPILPALSADERIVSILMEDPGHDMNPANAATVPTRRRLSETTMWVYDGI